MPPRKLPDCDISYLRTFTTVVILVVLIFLLVILNSKVAGNHGDWSHSDFMLIWLGGRSVVDGSDLFNPISWEAIHQKYAGDYRDNPVFLYPLPAAFLFVPFSLGSINFGAAFWLISNQIALIILAGLMIADTPYSRKLLFLFIFSLMMAIYLPVIIVIQSGQFSMFLLVILCGMYFLLERKLDWIAGVISVFLLIRPNAVIYFYPVMLIWIILQKRWKFLIGSGLTGLILLFGSELYRPGWISVWISYTVGTGGKLYTYAQFTPTLEGIFADYGTGVPPMILFSLSSVIILSLILLGIVACFNKNHSAGFILSLLVTISLCISPYVWNYDQILLLFPLIYLVQSIGRLYIDSKKTLQTVKIKVFEGISWVVLVLVFTLFPYLLRYFAIMRGKDTLSGLIPYTVLVLLLCLPLVRTRLLTLRNKSLFMVL